MFIFYFWALSNRKDTEIRWANLSDSRTVVCGRYLLPKGYWNYPVFPLEWPDWWLAGFGIPMEDSFFLSGLLISWILGWEAVQSTHTAWPCLQRPIVSVAKRSNEGSLHVLSSGCMLWEQILKAPQNDGRLPSGTSVFRKLEPKKHESSGVGFQQCTWQYTERLSRYIWNSCSG